MPDATPRPPGRVPVRLNVNGRDVRLSVPPQRPLLAVLRDDLGLTGTKGGCGFGNCGACTVLLDGRPVYSCLVLAVQCEGHAVRTVESLARDGTLHPVQQAFVQEDALQCGFCTPGQIMSVVALLEHNPDPSAEDLRQATAGNLCRCGAYLKIVRAGLAAAEQARRPDRPEDQENTP
jgi:aerobic-type carbon monoxide dehydrogenase small subunit (CoxS/CutS family)